MTDWIPHNGGPCPVSANTMVDLKWFTGTDFNEQVSTHRAGEFNARWRDGCIVAYRISKPTLEDRVAALEKIVEGLTK